MRSLLALLLVLTTVSCRTAAPTPSAAERKAIADTLTAMIERAYDFKQGDPVERIMGLYATGTEPVSAAAGRITTSRDSLRAQIRLFWDNVGKNMRDPKWVWGHKYFDVISPDAAVMTATYSIPHIQPNGGQHVIAGAWTALFQRRNGKWGIVQENLSDLPAAPAATAKDSMHH